MTDPQPGTPTAGALLRAAREKQGLHIAALAAAIKVSPRKLDALENDRWHELPDATFVRALAQTVCRTLKIESRPVMALLPITGEVMLEPVSNVLNEPFRDRPGRDGGGPGAAAIRPMVAIGLLLLLAAVVVYFLPASLWAPSPADPLVAQPSAPAAASAQPEAAPATWAADGASSPSGVSMVAADTAPRPQVRPLLPARVQPQVHPPGRWQVPPQVQRQVLAPLRWPRVRLWSARPQPRRASRLLPTRLQRQALVRPACCSCAARRPRGWTCVTPVAACCCRASCSQVRGGGPGRRAAPAADHWQRRRHAGQLSRQGR
jgi:cytoskeletal protein RodZ